MSNMIKIFRYHHRLRPRVKFLGSKAERKKTKRKWPVRGARPWTSQGERKNARLTVTDPLW